MVLWLSLFPAKVKAPQIEYPNLDGLIVVQGNSVMATSNPNLSQQMPVLGALMDGDGINYLKEIIKQKYPEIANLLICMLNKESSYCQNMQGDKGLAYGCFQIHINKHNITEWCAMDFECSLDFCYNMIKQGKGSLWSTYYKCLNEAN